MVSKSYKERFLNTSNLSGTCNDPIVIDDSDDENTVESSFKTFSSFCINGGACQITDFFRPLSNNIEADNEDIVSNKNNHNDLCLKPPKRRADSPINQGNIKVEKIENHCSKKIKLHDYPNEKKQSLLYNRSNIGISPSVDSKEFSNNDNFIKIKPKDDINDVVSVVQTSRSPDNKSNKLLLEKDNNLESSTNVYEIESRGDNFGTNFADGLYEQQLKNYRTYGKIITLDDETVGNILSIELAGKLSRGRVNDVQWDIISSKAHNLFKTVLSFVEHYDRKMKIETPRNFNGNLKPFQKEGLAFLVKRENSFPCGGILADDMGLGKTAQMISLILYQKDFFKNSKLELARVKKAKAKLLLPINATLVVAPTGLMKQWESEIRRFSKYGQLSIGIFYGNNRTKNPYDLAPYDVVLTSYGTVGSELAYLFENSDSEDDGDSEKSNKLKRKKKKSLSNTSVLSKVCFQRIILDEAHIIKNRKSLVSKACAHLSGLRRWCVTGTPIHNDLWDGFSLFRFLRTYPIDQESVWKYYINLSNKHGLSRLEILVQSILLRRTKDQVDEDDMDPSERLIYDQMFKAAQEFVRDFLEKYSDSRVDFENFEKSEISNNLFLNTSNLSTDPNDRFKNMACILVFLLRLRQACNHMFLTKSGIDLDCLNGGEDSTVQEDASTIVDSSTDIFLAESCKELNNDKKHLQVFECDFISSKLTALLEKIDKILSETNDKIIIVSQWTSMLRLLHPHLKQRKIEFVEITGEVDSKVRQLAQEDINNCNRNKRIMLLSLKAGGVGLNLIGANHVFILDPHWNPFMEDQACDRVYRIGQTKNVFIHKFICNNTIEQRVLNLQEKKRNLSNTFLKKAGSKKGYKLTNDDLAYLFEVK
uniref:Helicase C-terminal domain-containing protein n=1 Tax=Strongyloides stercoralis TaxID=6248 RepID=A0AAF5HZC9_STRER